MAIATCLWKRTRRLKLGRNRTNPEDDEKDEAHNLGVKFFHNRIASFRLKSGIKIQGKFQKLIFNNEFHSCGLIKRSAIRSTMTVCSLDLFTDTKVKNRLAIKRKPCKTCLQLTQ